MPDSSMSERRRRRLRLPRRAKYPIWSVKTITAYALVLILLTATCVFLLGKRSIFRDTELTLAIVSAALFVFLAVGLHHGVRVRRKDLPAAQMPDMPTPDFEAPDLGG